MAKGAAAFAIILASFITLGFYIASIVIGFQDANDDCQGHDKTGLSLATWLQVTGIVGLCSNVAMIGFLLCVFGCEGDNPCPFVSYVTLVFFNLCFVIAWFINGVVLVSRSHGSCVADSTSLGVMAMIMIVLQGLAILCSPSSSQAQN